MAKTEVFIIKKGAKYGIYLAMIMSWSVNHSVLWAIFHSLFSWIYVLYHVLKY